MTFCDRVGDTFRWKGENVSTSEVEIAASSMPGVKHAIVYGVAVPGHDGRVGMAALTPRDGIDLVGLYAHLVAQLPAYARPTFSKPTPPTSFSILIPHAFTLQALPQ